MENKEQKDCAEHENDISEISGSMTRLEVKQVDANGNDVWVDAGNVQVGSELFGGRGGGTTSSLKKALPGRVRSLLAAGCQSKSDRQSKYLYRHSILDKINTNLMIFLHGAGDTHKPFDALGKKMSLPQTALLSISASSCGDDTFIHIPFGLGHTWFEEMDLSTGNDLSENHPRRLSTLNAAVTKINEIIEALTESWIPERIFLFGFSAGACLAMETCLYRMTNRKRPLGGAICIAGGIKRPLPTKKAPGCESDKSLKNHKFTTPILIITGSNDTRYPPSKMQKSCDVYDRYATQHCNESSSVNTYVKANKDHSMIGSPDEMKILIQFLAEKLIKECVGPISDFQK